MVTDLGLSDIVSFEGFIDDNKLCDSIRPRIYSFSVHVKK